MKALFGTHLSISMHFAVSDNEEEEQTTATGAKVSNVLPVWGNEKSMNLNSLILTNIQGSPYFKVHLYAIKTYHEVVDEIYYKVSFGQTD